MSGDVPVGVRALHQPSQTQHLALLAQAADEGYKLAYDRSLSRQSLPAHESRVSQRTLPPTLSGGLRRSGGVIKSYGGTCRWWAMGQTHLTLFVRSIPEVLVIPHLHAMQNWDVYFLFAPLGPLFALGCQPLQFLTSLLLAIQIPPTVRTKLASINLPLVTTYLPTSEGACFKSVTEIWIVQVFSLRNLSHFITRFRAVPSQKSVWAQHSTKNNPQIILKLQ